MDIPVSVHKNYIKRGAILHSDIFNEIDHGKFFAIIGVSNNIVAGFFFINSRINPTIMKRQELLDLQFLLRQDDYDFLKYDSYLSATVIQKLSVEELAKSISNGRTNYVGNLTEPDLMHILEVCRVSRLFKESEKREYFS
jgi:hypothetical protein